MTQREIQNMVQREVKRRVYDLLRLMMFDQREPYEQILAFDDTEPNRFDEVVQFEIDRHVVEVAVRVFARG